MNVRIVVVYIKLSMSGLYILAFHLTSCECQVINVTAGLPHLVFLPVLFLLLHRCLGVKLWAQQDFRLPQPIPKLLVTVLELVPATQTCLKVRLGLRERKFFFFTNPLTGLHSRCKKYSQFPAGQFSNLKIINGLRETKSQTKLQKWLRFIVVWMFVAYRLEKGTRGVLLEKRRKETSQWYISVFPKIIGRILIQEQAENTLNSSRILCPHFSGTYFDLEMYKMWECLQAKKARQAHLYKLNTEIFKVFVDGLQLLSDLGLTGGRCARKSSLPCFGCMWQPLAAFCQVRHQGLWEKEINYTGNVKLRGVWKKKGTVFKAIAVVGYMNSVKV